MANAYDSLVRAYNAGEDDFYDYLIELREDIGALLCVFSDKDENFDDMSERELLEPNINIKINGK